MSILTKLYDKAPTPVQNLMTMAYGHVLRRQRYGAIYQRELAFLQHHDRQPAQLLRIVQQQRLRELVSHAIRHVPHYRDLAQREGFQAADINLDTLDELFPILDRAQVRAEPDRFVSDAFSRRQTTIASTSGTSGSPLHVIRSKTALQQNYAFFARFLNWHGLSPFSRSATFAGRTLVSSAKIEPPFWRRNPAMNDLQFSSYHISSDTISAYLQELARFQPEYIDAYPSAILALAKGLLAHDEATLIRPVAVITSSETLLPSQRAIIEEALDCFIRDQYGSVEMAMFVGQCEHGTYHAAPEYGLLEFTPEPSAEDSKLMSVITTGFLNLAMPLIRYRIGDLVEPGDETLCACGRAGTTIRSITGRLDDVIKTPDGRSIGRLGPVFKEASEILECQIVQTAINQIEVHAVPVPGCGLDPAGPIVAGLKARLPHTMAISVKLVPRIERGSNGKLRTVVSKIS